MHFCEKLHLFVQNPWVEGRKIDENASKRLQKRDFAFLISPY